MVSGEGGGSIGVMDKDVGFILASILGSTITAGHCGITHGVSVTVTSVV